MQPKIILNDDILKKIQNKSIETGIGTNKIINDVLNQGIENYPNSIKLSNKFEELRGICEPSEEDDIIELRNKIRERKF